MFKIPMAICVVAVVGCGGSNGGTPCHPLVGEYVVYAADFESASIDWGLGSMPVHTGAVVTGIPSLGDCQLGTGPGRMPSPANSTDCQVPREMAMGLGCVVTSDQTGFPRWGLDISGLGDSRTWPVGEVVPPKAYLYESYPSYVAESPGCQPGRTTKGADTGIKIVVEEAVGGIADYPQAVTPDYRKVFRVELDLNETLVSQEAGTCGITATMNLSARFVQSAANFQVMENQYCFWGSGCK